MQRKLIRLIRAVFSNATMLSVSDKSDSVNKCTQEISDLMKLHIQGVWQNARKYIRQLAHGNWNYCYVELDSITENDKEIPHVLLC